MARQRERKAALELQRVRSSIEVWRRTRLKRSPMPEKIWAKATQLARRLGVWRAASKLGLCYESLDHAPDVGVRACQHFLSLPDLPRIAPVGTRMTGW